MNRLDRRKLFKLMAMAGVGTGLPFQMRQALGATSGNRKFVLAVQTASIPGYDTSLLMPYDVGVYPKGVWHHGVQGVSANPMVNQHFKDGHLVFNRYSKMLMTISDHMCQGVVFPRSLHHKTASEYQLMGAKGNAGFVSGAADILNTGNSTPAFVRGFGNVSTIFNAAVKNTVLIQGASPAAFSKAFEDISRLRKDSNVRTAFDLQHQFLGTNELAAELPSPVIDALKAYERQLFDGPPPSLATDSPESEKVNAFFDINKVWALIDTHVGADYDAANIKAQYNADKPRWEPIWDQFKTAALLALTGVAKGYDIFLRDRQHDLHNPHNESGDSGSVESARSASIYWSMLTVFWQFIKSEDMADDVLVFVTGEFNRTAYNHYRIPEARSVRFGDENVLVDAYGTDHAPANGYLFINGRVPAKQRFGNVVDNYSVFGSATGNGVPDVNIPGYTSSKLVLSMFMRVFDGIFPSTQEMRRYWQDFDEAIPAIVT